MYIQPMFVKYPPEQQRLLEYWFTANGLSYGKALNKDGDYALVSSKDHKIDKEKSRRVEFRIITTGDEVLENFVKKIRLRLVLLQQINMRSVWKK